MASYQTHLIAGILISFVSYYFLKDLISLPPEIVFVSVVFIFLGSVFPDIDHKNSKIHKMTKSFVVLIMMAIFGFLALPNISASVLSASLVGLGSYSLITSLKPKHRGITHSFKFCAISSMIVSVFSFAVFRSWIPGLFFFLAYLSHLGIDFLS